MGRIGDNDIVALRCPHHVVSAVAVDQSEAIRAHPVEDVVVVAGKEIRGLDHTRYDFDAIHPLGLVQQDRTEGNAAPKGNHQNLPGLAVQGHRQIAEEAKNFD